MRIGAFDTARKVLIVAEVGNNHEGRPEAARELVQRAAEAGADAVKFQTFRTEDFVGPGDPTRAKRLKSFELPQEEFSRLAEHARSLGLLFISTPLDMGSADFLDGIVDAFKIASGDNNFWPLIDRVASFGKPVIFSTGLATLAESAAVSGRLRVSGRVREMAGLHCVTSYPVPDAEANLRAIPRLAEALGCTVGYSDHTLGIEAAVLAVGLGARIVEKHFTLDKDFSDFRDHKLSAEPAELAELVRRIRRAEMLLGSGEKIPQPCEAPFLVSARRSVVAARALAAGRVLEIGDLSWMRPGDALAPGQEERLAGKRLKAPKVKGEAIRVEDCL